MVVGIPFEISVSYQNVSWSSGQRGLNSWNTPFKLFSFTCLMRRSQYSARWGSQVFYNRQSACLPFALRKSIIFIVLDSEHACSLLQRQTFSLLYMERAMPAFATEEDTFFTFKHPWKDSLEPREAKGLLVKRAETWLMHENRLPAINICYSYQKKVFFF